ncbi:MAG: hypothetical protein ACTHNM_09550 [Dyella sp.]|uniref:hypothetical protein n=1 Tax=Dyella sp. TaxID=1869338 RepID=UPI003F7CE22B
MTHEVDDLDEAPPGSCMPFPRLSGLEIRPLLSMAEVEALQTPQTKEIHERIRAELEAHDYRAIERASLEYKGKSVRPLTQPSPPSELRGEG